MRIPERPFRSHPTLLSSVLERKEVQSSNLVSVGYDPNTLILEIEFKSGIYHYYSVPPSVHEGLMSASSKGKYFSQEIKEKYSFSKV